MDATIYVSIAGTKLKQLDKTFQYASTSSGFSKGKYNSLCSPTLFYLQKYKLIGREKHKRMDILHIRSSFNENASR